MGASWGKSTIDANSTEAATGNLKDEMWTIGAYHPLTKYLNLVAEYSDVKTSISGSNVTAYNVEGKDKNCFSKRNFILLGLMQGSPALV